MVTKGFVHVFECLFMHFFKIFFGTFWAWFDRWGVWSPVSRAHLSVCLHELEGLHQAQRLLHAAPHGQVIDTQVLDDPVWINDEQPSQCYARSFQQHPIITGDLFCEVRQNWNIHFAQTAALSWCIYPGQMTKMRVHRNCHHLTVHVTEFLCFVTESHNFRGADKGAGGKRDQAVMIL